MCVDQLVLIQLIFRNRIADANRTKHKTAVSRCVCCIEMVNVSCYMFAIITQKETKVSNRINLKWNEEIISWVIGKHTSENIKSNRSGSVGCFDQEKKKMFDLTRKKQQILMARCTECKAKKGTKSSRKHRDRMGKRPYSAPRNKLMTDHLSFLMITLRQKFGISLNVLQQSCHSHFYTCASLLEC